MPSPNPPHIGVFASTQAGALPSGPAAAVKLAQQLHEHGAQLVYGGGTTGLMGVLAQERVRLGGMGSVIGVTPYALVDSERQGEGRGRVAEKKGKLGNMLRMLGGGGDDVVVNHTNSKKNATTASREDGWSDADFESMPYLKAEDVIPLPSDPKYGRVVGVPSLSRRKAVMMELVGYGGPGSGFVSLPGGFGSLDEVLEVLTARQLGMHRKMMVLYNVDGFWDGLTTWMDQAVERGFLVQECRSYVKIVSNVEEVVQALSSG